MAASGPGGIVTRIDRFYSSGDRTERSARKSQGNAVNLIMYDHVQRTAVAKAAEDTSTPPARRMSSSSSGSGASGHGGRRNISAESSRSTTSIHSLGHAGGAVREEAVEGGRRDLSRSGRTTTQGKSSSKSGETVVVEDRRRALAAQHDDDNEQREPEDKQLWLLKVPFGVLCLWPPLSFLIEANLEGASPRHKEQIRTILITAVGPLGLGVFLALISICPKWLRLGRWWRRMMCLSDVGLGLVLIVVGVYVCVLDDEWSEECHRAADAGEARTEVYACSLVGRGIRIIVDVFGMALIHFGCAWFLAFRERVFDNKSDAKEEGKRWNKEKEKENEKEEGRDGKEKEKEKETDRRLLALASRSVSEATPNTRAPGTIRYDEPDLERAAA